MSSRGTTARASLSPSRASDFVSCPLLFRYRTIDRIPDTSSPNAVRGTLVHSVLEEIFDLPAATRTPEAARALLEPSWEALLEKSSQARAVREELPDEPEWLESARRSLDGWFTLEDPTRLEPLERETFVEAELPSGLTLRGIVDRLDQAPDGALRVVDYKGLALDTPLPTPTGWTTMGAVQVGDRLLGRDGRPTTVTSTSEVHHRPCYRVRFADGAEVVCDNVHLWTVVVERGEARDRLTVGADDLAALVAAALRTGRVVVEPAAPLAGTAGDLPDDPGLLGKRLGTGEASVLSPTHLRAPLEHRRSLLRGLIESAGGGSTTAASSSS